MSLYTLFLQSFLSLVKFVNIVIVSITDVFLISILSFKRSFMIVFSHVVFGLPLFFFVMESASFNDFRTGVSAFRRIICPKKINLLQRIVMLHRSSFVIRYNFSVDI